jgi:hypothetical protein
MILPKGSVRVATITVVEYMTKDGEIFTESEAFDTANEELALGKTLELLEVARAKAIAPTLAHEVAQYCLEDTADDDE